MQIGICKDDEDQDEGPKVMERIIIRSFFHTKAAMRGAGMVQACWGRPEPLAALAAWLRKPGKRRQRWRGSSQLGAIERNGAGMVIGRGALRPAHDAPPTVSSSAGVPFLSTTLHRLQR